ISFFSLNDAIYQEHQVLTIETGKLSWRMIELHPATVLISYNGKLASLRPNNFLRKWTCSNEVVLVKYSLYGPFYVFYYSLETETSRIVEIQGLGSFGGFRIYTFVDHVRSIT
ncbi:unnamed protein product, partial [Brassica oleracea]